MDLLQKKYLDVEGVGVEDTYRNKTLLRQKVTPQRVTLPNGRSFLATYERISRKKLSANDKIERAWIIGTGRQRKLKTQQGAGILGSAFNMEKVYLTLTY